MLYTIYDEYYIYTLYVYCIIQPVLEGRRLPDVLSLGPLTSSGARGVADACRCTSEVQMQARTLTLTLQEPCPSAEEGES